MAESKRTEALWRIVAFLWSLVAAFIVQFLGILALLYGAIDVLWQLVTGSEGLPAGDGIGSFLSDLLYWPVDNLAYAAFGDGELNWLP